MTSLRDELRGVIEGIRGAVPGELGLRPNRVDVVRVGWSGAAPGVGTKTVTSTRVLIDGKYNPKVTDVSTNDVARSNGLYESGDMRIGPVTPEFAGGGITFGVLLDPAFVKGTEVYYVVQGQGMHANGAWCQLVSSTQTRPFRYELVVRKAGTVPNLTLPVT